jgi:hypothetical protein
MSRKTRIDEFKNGGRINPYMSFSQNLIWCANSELILSLEDRCEKVVCLKDNHYSPHAVGSIILLVTGLDSLLNEGLSSIKIIPGSGNVMDFADRPTMEKYYGTIQDLDGTITTDNDLDLVIKLRDEIVHYLPRNICEKGPRKYLPRVFYGLDRSGLFFRYPDSLDYEVPFGDLICSYRLVHWAWKTVDMALNKFIAAFSSTRIPFVPSIYTTLYPNFQNYQKIPSPDDLAAYDAQNGLELTIPPV